MRVEGQEGSAAIVAKDLVKDIDQSFKTIFDKSMPAAERVKNKDAILTQMDDLLKTADDTVVNNEFKRKGFNKTKMKDFKQSLDNIRVGKKQQNELVSSLTKIKKGF